MGEFGGNGAHITPKSLDNQPAPAHADTEQIMAFSLGNSQKDATRIPVMTGQFSYHETVSFIKLSDSLCWAGQASPIGRVFPPLRVLRV